MLGNNKASNILCQRNVHYKFLPSKNEGQLEREVIVSKQATSRRCVEWAKGSTRSSSASLTDTRPLLSLPRGSSVKWKSEQHSVALPTTALRSLHLCLCLRWFNIRQLAWTEWKDTKIHSAYRIQKGKETLYSTVHSVSPGCSTILLVALFTHLDPPVSRKSMKQSRLPPADKTRLFVLWPDGHPVCWKGRGEKI